MMISFCALAFYEVDPFTHQQTNVSRIFGYLDGSSFHAPLGNNAPILTIAIGIFYNFFFIFAALVAVFFQKAYNRWPLIIECELLFHDLIQTILFIPSLHILIDVIDCFNDSEVSENVLRSTHRLCFERTPLPLIARILSYECLPLLLIMFFLINILITQQNPKHGGITSISNGMWTSVFYVMIFGCVFAMRMLVDWPFWRGLVTIGTSAAMATVILLKQPFYTYAGNCIHGLMFVAFGTLRLCSEIGMGANKDRLHFNGQYLMMVLGGVFSVILGIVYCIFLKKKMKKLWFFSEEQLNSESFFTQYEDSTNSFEEGVEQKNSSSNNGVEIEAKVNSRVGKPLQGPPDEKEEQSPAMTTLRKRVMRLSSESYVEKGFRFLQYKQYRTDELIELANSGYLIAFQKFSLAPDLVLDYTLFQEFFAKNMRKASQLLTECRMMNLPMRVAFTINSKTLRKQIDKDKREQREKLSGVRKNRRIHRNRNGYNQQSYISPSSSNSSLMVAKGNEDESKGEGGDKPANGDEQNGEDTNRRGGAGGSGGAAVGRKGGLSSSESTFGYGQYEDEEEDDFEDEDDMHLSTMALQAKITAAEEEHENVRNELQMFWRIMLSQSVDTLKIIPKLINNITKASSAAKKGYEEALDADPMNVKLLNNYGQLLLEVFHDDTMAEVFFARAIQAEEEFEEFDPDFERDTKRRGSQFAGSRTQFRSGSHAELPPNMNYTGNRRRRRSRKNKDSLSSMKASILMELNGNRSSKNVAARFVLASALIALLICIAFIGTSMIFSSFASNHITEFESLQQICSAVTSASKLSAFGMFLHLHEVENFVNKDVEITVRPRVSFCSRRLIELANIIESVTLRLYEDSENVAPWETVSIEMEYFSTVTSTINEYGGGNMIGSDDAVKSDEDLTVSNTSLCPSTSSDNLSSFSSSSSSLSSFPPTNSSASDFSENNSSTSYSTSNSHTLRASTVTQVHKPTSMMDLLAILVQKARLIGSSDSPETNPDFHTNIMFLMCNTFQSAVEGGKKILFAMYQSTSDANDRIITSYSVVLSNVVNLLSIIYLIFSIVIMYDIISQRKSTYAKLYSMTKQQVQEQLRLVITGMNHKKSEGIEGQFDEEDADCFEPRGKEYEYADTRLDDAASLNPSDSMNPLLIQREPSLFGSSAQFPSPRPQLQSQASQPLLPPSTSLSMLQFQAQSPRVRMPSPLKNNVSAENPQQPLSAQQIPSSSISPMRSSQAMVLQCRSSSFSTPYSPQSNTNTGANADCFQATSSSFSSSSSSSSNSSSTASFPPVFPLMSNASFSSGSKFPDLSALSALNKKLPPLLRDLNENDEEHEQPRGFLRRTVADDEWEQQLFTDLDKMEDGFKHFPADFSVVDIIMMLSIFVFNYLCTVAAIEVVAQLTIAFKDYIAMLIVSGLRPSVLVMIQVIMMRIVTNDASIDIPNRMEYAYSTNPAWNSTDHMCTDRKVLATIMFKLNSYLNRMHRQIHFGNHDAAKTSDFIIDNLPNTRAPTAVNGEALLHNKECFVQNKETCSSLDLTTRLYRYSELAPPSLMMIYTRLCTQIQTLSHCELSTITAQNPIYPFVVSAVRYDLLEGMDNISNYLVAAAAEQIKSAQNVVILVSVGIVLCIIILDSCLLTFLYRSFRNKTKITNSLMLMLPEEDEEKVETSFTKAMTTDFPALDERRREVMEIVQNLFESLNWRSSTATIVSLYEALMAKILEAFQREERAMNSAIRRASQPHYSPITPSVLTGDAFSEDACKSPFEDVNSVVSPSVMTPTPNAFESANVPVSILLAVRNYHTRQHLIIRQRLTVLGDIIKAKKRETTIIGKKQITMLLQNHFTRDDQALALLLRPNRPNSILRRQSMIGSM
ncbi:uncharacterized protein MONOS_11917 [Monocercomonoides exilis]|uniref:uncharacterized protein n=1 Tax=Monocercomonoides exilis TaxID=2049356 RepID=UPI00355A1AAF|nr:hypothetical protein MONOS_11917 [Monocercomonoides exilis]|eukprot:MONOS_11917.1-p1 / transcript=MONOS_11917.1 / gene=MONOS_11917 / organism=Monocercomonoides_exilis_PA203 / gene_product=unspecified product / transcript_product=unspecified product / location=Mono_scaffold00625:3856-9456(+) / protein_length=1867 / sequence_SO=supercontig / SO=protein_coding / is_pseudo=false